jgi:hypothetical protein
MYSELYKNLASVSAVQSPGVSNVAIANGSVQGVFCNAGDTLYIKAQSNATTPAYGGNSQLVYFTATRQSGPATIAASEKIYADYRLTVTQSIPDAASTLVNFNDKIVDSHGAVTVGAAWKFTAPRSDWYTINAAIIYQTNSNLVVADIYIFKNNAIYRALGAGLGVQGQYLQGNLSIYLLAGEYISLYTYQDDTTSAARDIYNGINGFGYSFVQISSQ